MQFLFDEVALLFLMLCFDIGAMSETKIDYGPGISIKMAWLWHWMAQEECFWLKTRLCFRVIFNYELWLQRIYCCTTKTFHSFLHFGHFDLSPLNVNQECQKLWFFLWTLCVIKSPNSLVRSPLRGEKRLNLVAGGDDWYEV